MSSFGNKDDKTSTGTVAIAANGLVTGTSTKFDEEAQVSDILTINSTVDYVITEIRSNTNIQVINGALADGDTITVINAGNNYTLSEKPVYVATSEVGGDLGKVYGVDDNEIAADGGKIAHTGWVRRTAGTGGRSGRILTEVLVAGGISGDAEDDVYPDYLITITSQPSGNTANTTASEEAEFTVVATSTPSTTLTFAWTYANGDALQSGANVGNTTQATLTVNSGIETANVDFKVTISATGADDVVSSNATLTITT
jgi:hypothetical protein